MCNEISGIVKKLNENNSILRIRDIPMKYKKRFQAIAKSDFCDDYATFMVHLINLYHKSDLHEKINELDARLLALEKKEVI